jgi:hypothetical protein
MNESLPLPEPDAAIQFLASSQPVLIIDMVMRPVPPGTPPRHRPGRPRVKPGSEAEETRRSPSDGSPPPLLIYMNFCASFVE